MIRPRIGLSFPGDPRRPGTWSGIPFGLTQGLARLDVDVAPVDAELHRYLRRALQHAGEEPRVHLRSVKAHLGVLAGGRLDGLLRMGYEYNLPQVARLVTLDDMTIEQGIDLGHPWFRRSSTTTRAWIKRQRAAFEQARYCCVASRWAGEAIVRGYGIPEHKVRVVGFGRNLDPNPDRGARDWSVPRFLFVGREWKRKDGPGLLRSFARLRREVPAARLDIVGGHPAIDVDGVTTHGPLRLGVLEERARLQQLFELATCFVMPSQLEPFGMVHLEAAAAGIASIGTTVGGAGEAIGPGGRLVPPRDEEALLTAMRELADGSTAAELGARGRAHTGLYTWDLVAERVARAFAFPLDRELAPDL